MRRDKDRKHCIAVQWLLLFFFWYAGVTLSECTCLYARSLCWQCTEITSLLLRNFLYHASDIFCLRLVENGGSRGGVHLLHLCSLHILILFLLSMNAVYILVAGFML
uniref:Uncharacterized protein n=1 Tax=Amblyomma cajennense TaxID=34607 RepID=A0A023FBP5_AMBCJ